MSTCTLTVLAGGEGSRMGRPKGLITIAGRPILETLLQQLQWTGPTLLVTAPGRERPPGWRGFDREVSDPVAGEGPLRGILTALSHLQTPAAWILTVDMPAITAAQLAYLTDQLDQRPEALGVLLRRGDGMQPRLEPFPCILRAAARVLVAARLQAGQRSIYPLGQDPRFAVVDEPGWPAETWTNLNHPADLQAFGAQLSVTPAKD